MATDAALKTCLLWLAAVIAVVGLSTHSALKMLLTYILGVLGIAGVLLPDWDYFNRHFSRWPHPVTARERAALLPHPHASPFLRFASSPLRVTAYAAIYGYAIYRWWGYVSDSS
ncbi:signal peptidase complex-like protein DTM1 [Prosopis cineraria]|uniref:signal peptidase complex-like protein DTM1 n=1 Tax=Prosopis cineraria TaxID=364024 RepID=UPI00241032A7|nr:signal peptidase complex-like protein DTM1 [Prosopis cineraria]